MILKKQPLISFIEPQTIDALQETITYPTNRKKGKSSSSYSSALVQGICDRFQGEYPFIEHSFGPQNHEKWRLVKGLSPKSMGYYNP